MAKWAESSGNFKKGSCSDKCVDCIISGKTEVCHEVWPSCFNAQNSWEVDKCGPEDSVRVNIHTCFADACNLFYKEGFMYTIPLGLDLQARVTNHIKLMKKHRWIDQYTEQASECPGTSRINVTGADSFFTWPACLLIFSGARCTV